MKSRFRIVMIAVLLLSTVGWTDAGGSAEQARITFERPYGMHLERYKEGLTTEATGPQGTMVVPEGYYDTDLSYLIPEGVSFYDFLAHYIRWVFPYWYDHFDCTEMSAAIEWLAEGCGQEARVVCNKLHCWVEVQLDGHWRAYECVHLKWVEGRATPQYIFDDSLAMLSAPWPGNQFDWWVYSASPGASGSPGWEILGSHTVRLGEHVYSIARAYGVDPEAIKAQNGVGDALVVGQVLLIPNVPKVLAAGPTAVRQFGTVQPNPTPAPAPTPVPVPQPAPTPTPEEEEAELLPPAPIAPLFDPVLPFEVIGAVSPAPPPVDQSASAAILGYHTVRTGENLWMIGRTYGVDPRAIKRANNITGENPVVGQRLEIPNVPMGFPPGPTTERQFTTNSQPNSEPNVAQPWPAQIEQWRHLIEPAAAKYGLDPNLVAAVMLYESAGQAAAISTSGAVGLMQVMPRETGFPSRPTTQQLRDPAFNVEWGCKILARCIADYDSVYTALACYYGFGGALTAKYQADVWAIYQGYIGGS